MRRDSLNNPFWGTALSLASSRLNKCLAKGNICMCILVVEDDVTLGQLLLKQCQKLGYLADLVESAAEAIEMFKRKPYDLVMMDVGLPDADGLETTANMRNIGEHGKTVKIVGVTAGYASRNECLSAGMNDYYQKPVLADDVKRILDRWEARSCETC